MGYAPVESAEHRVQKVEPGCLAGCPRRRNRKVAGRDAGEYGVDAEVELVGSRVYDGAC